ncbi:MAG: hypothetical protein IJA30_04040 [Bacilli bacterium]|nr:hypothetical protein [Bacilli bacterium]
MKKNYKSKIILIFLIILLTLYLLNSELITKNIIEYTNLFITKLFPSSFLIFTISSLLINYQIIETFFIKFKKPATSYVIIMSLISGFPSGPKYITQLYQKNYISEKEANRLLSFCHFPNPLFILGTLPQILNSKKIAIKILISLISSNILLSFLNKNKEKQILKSNQITLPFSISLNNAIISSLKLQILIYGTNIFFYLISVIITNNINKSPTIYALINSTFDLIKGPLSTSLIPSILVRSIIIISSLSLGSLSLNIQIKSILSDTSLSYKSFIFGRIISTIISIIIFLLIY